MEFFLLLQLWKWLVPIMTEFAAIAWAFFTWRKGFAILFFYRYFRLVGNCIAHWNYKSTPIPDKPSLDANDVTVVIPTIHNRAEELRESLESILATNMAKLILVTTADKFQNLRDFAATLSSPNVEVYFVNIANKRLQVCEVIPLVQTRITIMADDDVTWPNTILPWLLAPFEDLQMGGVGPCQRVKRLTSGSVTTRAWNWLGAAYIERRNFEISATHKIDGGTSCMSGRTCAFRTEILQDPLFLHGFRTERWGSYHLNADDDNFVTRWLVSHQYKTWIQYNAECEIETTLENNPNFMRQCLRWARSNWRSNWTSLITERYVWSQQIYCVYALHLATFTSLAFLVDPFLIYACYKASLTANPFFRAHAVWLFCVWLLLTKIVKLIGLFRRDPSDIMFLPVSIFFGWFHGIIKLYALLTLRETSWGSRADGDLNDSARMTPRRRAESVRNPGPGQKGLVRYVDNRPYTFEHKTFANMVPVDKYAVTLTPQSGPTDSTAS